MQRYNGSGNPQSNGNFILYEDYLKEINKMFSCRKCNTPLIDNAQKYCHECGSCFMTPKNISKRVSELEVSVIKLIHHVKTGEPWED